MLSDRRFGAGGDGALRSGNDLASVTVRRHRVRYFVVLATSGQNSGASSCTCGARTSCLACDPRKTGAANARPESGLDGINGLWVRGATTILSVQSSFCGRRLQIENKTSKGNLTLCPIRENAQRQPTVMEKNSGSLGSFKNQTWVHWRAQSVQLASAAPSWAIWRIR